MRNENISNQYDDLYKLAKNLNKDELADKIQQLSKNFTQYVQRSFEHLERSLRDSNRTVEEKYRDIVDIGLRHEEIGTIAKNRYNFSVTFARTMEAPTRLADHYCGFCTYPVSDDELKVVNRRDYHKSCRDEIDADYPVTNQWAK